MSLKHWIPAALFCFLALAAPARPSLAQADIPESKRRVILELVDLFHQQTPIQKMVDAMLVQMEKTYPKMVADLVSRRTDLSQADKEAFLKDLSASYARFSARYRERVSKEIDFRKFQEEASLPLYDKFFTEQELRDLLAFYRTPTGQKALQAMPELLAESMRQASVILGPQVTRIVQEVLQEEVENLKKQPKSP